MKSDQPDVSMRCIIRHTPPTVRAAGASMPADREALSLTAVPAELLLRLLRQAGARHASREALDADRAAGAPIAPDGTVDLVAYAAWLARGLAHGA